MVLALSVAACSPAPSHSTPILAFDTTTPTVTAARPTTAATNAEASRDDDAHRAAVPDGLFEIRTGAGFCLGACWTRITFVGDDFRYESKDHAGELLRTAVGQLSADGADQVSEAIAQLETVEIEERYGPIWPDSTGLMITMVIDGRLVETNYQMWELPRKEGRITILSAMSSGEVPLEFVALNDIVRELLTALRRCRDHQLFDLSFCENDEPDIFDVERGLG